MRTPKADPEVQSRIIAYINSQIEWCMELDQRFRERGYDPEVEERLLRQNDLELQRLERELRFAKAGA